MSLRLLVTSALATVLVAGAGQAADILPTKAPVLKAPAAAPFSWTGFYIGGHAGYGWGDKKWSDYFETPLSNGVSVPGPDASYDVSGALGGGQIGYNFQYGSTVFGIEADVSAADIHGRSGKLPSGFTGCLALQECTSKIDALGTITGRLGVAVDRVLFYAKGGAAWVNEKHTLRAFDPQSPNDPFLNFSGTTSQTRWGWTAGAGVEYALSNNWSAKIEYNYLDFGKDEVTFTFTPKQFFGAGGTLEQTMHVVKGGVNYRFSY